MLTVRFISSPENVSAVADPLCPPGLSAASRRRVCRERGLFVLAVLDGASLAGFALAESSPRAVRFRRLEGGPEACRLLVARLARAAGERDVCGWCPAGRVAVRRALRQAGFALVCRTRHGGTDTCFYYLDRNRDL